MNPRSRKIAAASVAGAGVVAALAFGSDSLAFAETPTPTPSASSSASPSTSPSATTGTPSSTTSPSSSGKDGSGRGSNDTPVTGSEADKVSAAVTAKDSAVTVTSVRKDPDGSYDVLGTKAGAPVMFDVSADLATITQNTGHGGHGGASNDTPVTGAEADKVSAAVTAKDSAVTVTSVRKDPDGSYDALGTKAGAPVMFDVSADLATITQNTHTQR